MAALRTEDAVYTHTHTSILATPKRTMHGIKAEILLLLLMYFIMFNNT